MSGGPTSGGRSGAVQALEDHVLLALDGLVELSADDDGSLSFEYEGVPCAVRVLALAEGLEMVSMTCVLAWDLETNPAGGNGDAPRPGLAALAEQVRREVQFGSLQVVDRGPKSDVLLQYVFPGGGLTRVALTTMLLLVLEGAGDARALLLR